MSGTFDPVAAGGIPYGGEAQETSAQPSPGSPTDVIGPSGGPMAAGPPPGFTDVVNANVAQQNAMAARSHTYGSDMYSLLNANQDLKTAPTGAGSQLEYDASNLLRTFTPDWLQQGLSHILPIMTPAQTDAYAGVQKFLTQMQVAGPGATRSNEGLATAGAASPSTHIPNAEAQLLVQGAIGLRRQEQDQTLQWQQSGQPITNLQGFVTQFQTNADPRAYEWDLMSPQARTGVMNSLKAADQKNGTQSWPAFMNKVQGIDQRGLYNNFAAPQ